MHLNDILGADPNTNVSVNGLLFAPAKTTCGLAFIDNRHIFYSKMYPKKLTPDIKNVIFNNPATIVLWADGTKTVVKAQDGDVFDPEKGLAMAISKKALGNKGNYCNELKKWLPKKEETIPPITMSELADNIEKFSKKVKEVFGGK